MLKSVAKVLQHNNLIDKIYDICYIDTIKLRLCNFFNTDNNSSCSGHRTLTTKYLTRREMEDVNVKYLMMAMASAAIMLLEVTSIRLYSFSLWYHMVPLIVGETMTAFSIATLFLHKGEWKTIVWRPKRARWMPDAIRFLCQPVCHTVTFVSWALATQQRIIRDGRIDILAVEGAFSLLGIYFFAAELFHPARVLTSLPEFFGFSAMVFAMALPYFFFGAIINLIFCSEGDKGGVYACDLIGASTGALLGAVSITIGSQWGFGFAAFVAMTIALIANRRPTWKRGLVYMCLAGAIMLIVGTIHLPLYSGKSKGQIPGYSIAPLAKKRLETKESLLCRLDIVSNAPTVDESSEINLIMDGSASTQIRKWDGNISSLAVVKKELYSAPYHLTDKGKVLIIGPGGGQEVRAALYFGNQVVGADINPQIVEATRDTYGEWAGNLYRRSDVDIQVSEGRHFVSTSTDKYQVIQLSLVDTWAASAQGAMSLSENTLYTVEAFRSYIDHLSEDGVLAITRWHDTSQPLRLCSVGWNALLSLGVDDPGNHMVVLQDWPDQGGQVSMTDHPNGSNKPREDIVLIKRTPWTSQELEKVDRVCTDQTWEIRYAPDHSDSDSEFALLLDPETHETFLKVYGQNVTPTTDDNPHFFQEERPEVLLARIWKIGRGFGSGSSGTNTLIAAALLLALMSLLVIIAHFWSLRREPKSAGVYRLTVFNALLGLGFMFVAIPLSQKVGLVMGNPTISFLLTFPVLILALGFGSFVSRTIRNHSALLGLGGFAIVLGIISLKLYAGTAEQAMLHWSLWGKIGVVIPVVFFFGIPLGFFTPSGMTEAEDCGLGHFQPLFWGVNLSLSAAATSVATLISLLGGNSLTLSVGGGIYAMATVIAVVSFAGAPSLSLARARGS
ncbi:MAG: spermidine synthase [Bacteroidetes bacterium ADurb.BinA104]|nr:MAG: spermidine synthase [Bacteroidetes bacterium ADurb.BinA104]